MYDVGQEEIQAISEVIKSQQLFRYKGKDKKGHCDLFEEELCSLFDCSHALLLSSGTNSLITALKAAGIKQGDEVIIPAYTFVATALAVLKVGAIPILANVDSTFTLDAQDTRNKITNHTKAIIPVHIDGLCCNLEAFLKLAKEYNLIIIEDVAQAIGGSYQGRRLGTWGDFGCYSLNMDKIISTGEGGILVSKDKKHHQISFCFHDSACQYGPTKKESLDLINPFAGESMRVSEITGAMARSQLKKLDSILQKLRCQKQRLAKVFHHHPKTILHFGHDQQGDCGTTLHLSLSSPQEAMDLSRIMLKEGIEAFPLHVRLAHFCWQWKNLLYNQNSQLGLSDEDVKILYGHRRYFHFDFLETLDLVSRTVIAKVPYHWEEKQFEQFEKVLGI